MNKISYEFAYEKNSDLIMSPAELWETYFFGIDLKVQGGREFTTDTIKFYIKAATLEVENFLNLKFKRQVVEESKSYLNDDFKRWGFVRATYPVVKPLAVDGYIGSSKRVGYPVEWLSSKISPDSVIYDRNIYLIPSAGSPQMTFNTFVGVMPFRGFFDTQEIPQYWRLKYETGFEKIPEDILNVIGKLAAINIFHIAGDLILGAGIASQSISIDGLSQSISTTSSATNAGYGSRIVGYTNDLKRLLPQLKSYYKGFTFNVL